MKEKVFLSKKLEIEKYQYVDPTAARVTIAPKYWSV